MVPKPAIEKAKSRYLSDDPEVRRRRVAPSRLAFGKFKGRLFYEAVEDSNLRSWLDWLADSSNEKSAMMGRWYLVQLEAGSGPQDAVLFDLEIQEGEHGSGSGLVVFQAPEIGHYTRLVEAARIRLAHLELEYGIGRSKVDSIQATLFGALQPFYQERDRLRLLIQYRKIFINRLLTEGEEAAEATADDYQREATDKDREYESTASALKGKRELNEEETTKLKKLWRKLVRMDSERDAPWTDCGETPQPRPRRGKRETSSCWSPSRKIRRRLF